MPRRPRPLSETDRAAWTHYAQGMRLLPGRSLAPMQPAAVAAAAPATLPTQRPAPAAAPRLRPGLSTLITGSAPPGLDKGSWHRFQGGRLAATRTLDLHGKTAQAAYLALDRFLRAAVSDHVRCVEIITGRGSGEHGGVIRRELPLWLNQPGLRPLILAAAHPHALNPGSTRLLLRRQRG